MKTVFSFFVLFAVVSWLFCFPQTAAACQRPMPISLDEMCLKADAIVRATAVAYVKPPPSDNIKELNTPVGVEILFDVKQVIKGSGVPETVTLNGISRAWTISTIGQSHMTLSGPVAGTETVSLMNTGRELNSCSS